LIHLNGLTQLADVTCQYVDLTGNLDISGNVGIGGDSGTETLLVAGSERVTSNLHVGGNLVVDGSFKFQRSDTKHNHRKQRSHP